MIELALIFLFSGVLLLSGYLHAERATRTLIKEMVVNIFWVLVTLAAVGSFGLMAISLVFAK